MAWNCSIKVKSRAWYINIWLLKLVNVSQLTSYRDNRLETIKSDSRRTRGKTPKERVNSLVVGKQRFIRA